MDDDKKIEDLNVSNKNSKKETVKEKKRVTDASPGMSGKKNSDIQYTKKHYFYKNAKRTITIPVSATVTKPTFERMAIVTDTFPCQKLSKEQFGNIMRAILLKIDATPEGSQLPKFSLTSLVSGAAFLSCSDTFSVDWLKSNLHDNSEVIPNTTLKIVKSSELPRLTKIVCTTNDSSDLTALLKRLNRFNPEFKTERWAMISKTSEPPNVTWTFGVNEDAVKAIEAANCIGYSGIDKVVFEIIKDGLSTNPSLSNYPGTKEPVKSERTSPAVVKPITSAQGANSKNQHFRYKKRLQTMNRKRNASTVAPFANPHVRDEVRQRLYNDFTMN